MFSAVVNRWEWKPHTWVGAWRGRGHRQKPCRGALWTPTGLGTYGAKSPRSRRVFHLFFFFFCNSFYFVVVAVVVPEEVGVIQNTRVLPGTQQSSVPH